MSEFEGASQAEREGRKGPANRGGSIARRILEAPFKIAREIAKAAGFSTSK